MYAIESLPVNGNLNRPALSIRMYHRGITSAGWTATMGTNTNNKLANNLDCSVVMPQTHIKRSSMDIVIW